jgi:hypothetical protein
VKDFHLEIKSKEESVGNAIRRRKPSTKKLNDRFMGSIFEVSADRSSRSNIPVDISIISKVEWIDLVHIWATNWKI